MAVEEKKKSAAWVNPFSNMRNNGPFLVDEKGFGKFHIINLGSPKQQGVVEECKSNVQSSGEGVEAENSGVAPAVPSVSTQSPGVATQSPGVATQPHAVATQPHGVATQPCGVATQPHLVATQPHGVATQPHLVATQPHLVATQPHAVATQPHGVATQPHGVPSDQQQTSHTEAPSQDASQEVPIPDPVKEGAPPSTAPPSTAPPAPDTLPDPDTPVVKPSKPISPFMRFSSHIWAQVRDQKKAMKFADVGKMIGAKWRNLDEAERGLYQGEYDRDKVTYFNEMNNYRKYIERRDAKALLEAQLIQDSEDPNDPLAQLINQISQLKQKSTSIEKEFIDSGLTQLSMSELEKLITSESLTGHIKKGQSCAGGTPTAVKYEPCPNVNPFLMAATAQRSDGDTHKQLLQHRIMERIKNTATSSIAVSGGAVTTLTSSSFSSIPSTIGVPRNTETNENIRILKSLIPSYSQSPDTSSTGPPNYTALGPPNPAECKQSVPGGVMTPEQCQDMFQNIKKQITEQSVFGLTATIHQTSNENEGLILVVTRNKIDIHPQFGPIHVARVVITNKGYYKFFVLDKVVDSGQVGGKEISEVLWKLSDVSKHLLCPGFNQRYITKVEQTLSEKITDVSSSYCRLTAKLCNVWHQKESKNGQRRNYHTRDLCSECLDLYYRLQSKTYSLKQKQGSDKAQKRENLHSQDSTNKKPKLNGSFLSPSMSTSPPQSLTTHIATSLTYNSIEQQMRTALSTLVTNCSVVKVKQDCDGDAPVDILGDIADTSPTTAQDLLNQSNNILSQITQQLHPSNINNDIITTITPAPLPMMVTPTLLPMTVIPAPLVMTNTPTPLTNIAPIPLTNIAPNVVLIPNQITATFVLPNGGTVQPTQDVGTGVSTINILQDIQLHESEQQLQALLQTLAPNTLQLSNLENDPTTLANTLKDALLKIGGVSQNYQSNPPLNVAPFVETSAVNVAPISVGATVNVAPISVGATVNVAPISVGTTVNVSTAISDTSNGTIMDDSTEDSLVIQED